jgi:peptidoglycan/LPS O-acetylase OafA/YrhL
VNRTRQLSWDVVRVVAVASVVLQHATYSVIGVMPWMPRLPFVWPIQAGANTLMVISAFFVCRTLATRPSGRWWADRLARLLPAYVVAVLVTYLLTLYASQFGYWRPSGVDLIGNLLLVQGWDSRVTYIDHSYWTLPAQLAMFTLAAVAAALLGRGFWRRSWTLPALAWVIIVVPALMLELGAADGVLSNVFHGLVMFRWQMFGIGLAVWLWSRGRIHVAHLVALVVAALVAENLHTPDLPSVLVLALAVLGIAAAGAGRDWSVLRVGRLPRVITWLAGISYGIYLMNQQIGYFVAWGLRERFGVDGWPRLVAVVAVAVLLGWLLTVLVERPAHRWLVRRPSQAQRLNEPAADRKRSTSSGVPALTRTPSPANARTTTLFSSACSENSTARSPSGSQTKLVCEGGTSYPIDRSSEAIRATSATAPAQSACSSSRWSSAARAPACAADDTPNGTATPRSAAASSAGPIA